MAIDDIKKKQRTTPELCKDADETAILRAYRLLKDEAQQHIVRLLAECIKPDSIQLRKQSHLKLAANNGLKITK